MEDTATAIVRRALAGSGIEGVASCPIATYDARAPEDYRSPRFLPGARGLVVAGSAGTRLWRDFRDHLRAGLGSWNDPHPYDAYVGTLLDRADAALAARGVRSYRFEARFDAPVRVSFVALGELAGLGLPGPFGLLVHREYGPWWALRGAWLVDGDVEPPSPIAHPCQGCPAPCVGGARAAPGILLASPEARARCVVGQGWRYDPDQIAYHYDREATAARLAAEDRQHAEDAPER